MLDLFRVGRAIARDCFDGALSAEDGIFRMVLPAEGGKLNVRMLTSLTVIK